MDRWLKHKSTSSEVEPTQKKTPEPKRASTNSSASDVSVNNVTPQEPQSGNSNVSKVKQQSKDKLQTNWLRKYP